MLPHYLTIALRNLTRQKMLAFINIAGLSIGLSCFILFLVYTINEFSFDRFHKNADNIYRVNRWRAAFADREAGGTSYMPMPLGPAMKEYFPDVQEFIRIEENNYGMFIKAEEKVSRNKVSFVDASFFKEFSFKMIAGNASRVFEDPKNIVLTESKAKQLFGRTDVLGETVEIKVDTIFEPFKVNGILQDFPANSNFNLEIMGSWSYMESTRFGKRGVNNWNRSGFQTYVVLRPGSDLPQRSAQLASFRKKYYPDEEVEAKKLGWDKQGSPISFRLQPLKKIHTDITVDGSIAPVEPKNIWILLSIAASILLIATINFTTLAIGRFARRTKEIGVRKVIGVSKAQLIFQFLGEAVISCIISMILAIGLVQLLLPYFNQLSGRELNFSLTQYPELTYAIILLVLLTGLLSGIYPALILSGFSPVLALKNKIRIGGSNFFSRSLVTFQFALSIILIIATIVILQQLSFMKNKNPGFNKENVVMVDADGTRSGKLFPLFKQALASDPSIVSVAGAELGLGEGQGWSRTGFEYQGKQKNPFEYFVDNNYLDLMGIELVAGSNFRSDIASDTLTSILVNEAFVRDFGWTNESAIGQELKGYAEHKTPVVIGVVKDFNFLSLSSKIEPQLFHQFNDYAPYKYFVRIQPGDPSQALASMQKAWASMVPDIPFKYDFLDESLNRFYKEEQRLGNIAGWAGGISIFLSCLGLLGLASLAVINRTKEIGIRKILGAGTANIITLISKDFLLLVLIAFVLASPVAWYFMNQWLQDFAYRIHINWSVFMIGGILSVLIAIATISIQAMRAANMNPVKNLRTE